ncbi:hypothetical protein P152DRAFT_445484 [Eremomyces bilateralis CBS 781.70]|uniref:Histone h1.3 n=1 Tax=Eremomyces bilateralis CBS 781.70 TaxID=1392243 RepID=A0A6G1GHC9_9PEZI|nr:uncharacterized protein P152DRAFT_445484 [Eremomyces bilateralis CBS 781.70]KAF1817392.1 hypothetical protein P152DRAFT_445484 [Eremomyces bilateralis CBS 781.70]
MADTNGTKATNGTTATSATSTIPTKPLFTENEMKLLACAWQCIEGDIKVDYEKLANLAGYTKGSAATLFNGLRRRIRDLGGAASATTPGTPKTRKPRAKSTNDDGTPKSSSAKKRGRPKKVDAANDDQANGDDVTGDTPSKKRTKATSKSAAIITPDDDAESAMKESTTGENRDLTSAILSNSLKEELEKSGGTGELGADV